MRIPVLFVLILSCFCVVNLLAQEPPVSPQNPRPDQKKDGPQSGVDFIAAKVNDAVITTDQVMKKIGSGFEAIERNPYYTEAEKKIKKKALWKITLRELAEEQLLQQAAKRVEIEVSKKEIEQRVEAESKKAGGLENFLQVLSERGMALDDFREATRVHLTGQKLLLQKFGLVQTGAGRRPQLDTFISPALVRKYYNRHRARYRQEASTRIRQILIRPKKLEAGKDPVELVQSLRKQIEEGLDFEEAARTHSHGPNADRGGRWPSEEKDGKVVWRSVDRGNLLPRVEEAVFSAQSGEIVGPIKTRVGIFLIQLVERKETREIPFEQVQESIRLDLREEKIQSSVIRIKQQLIREAYIWPRDLFQ